MRCLQLKISDLIFVITGYPGLQVWTMMEGFWCIALGDTAEYPEREMIAFKSPSGVHCTL